MKIANNFVRMIARVVTLTVLIRAIRSDCDDTYLIIIACAVAVIWASIGYCDALDR